MEGEQVHVLSIQSHVVSGYVGNTAAVFPLQLLGFDVHTINSVQFSNHTGYPVVKGTIMNGTELDDLMDGLVNNDLCHFDYLLTGYIGSETFLNSILRVLEACKRINPKIKYVCDPVLGDNNKLYVPLPLIDIFRTSLIPRAFMITPNQLEAEYLSGIKITNETHVVSCMRKLQAMGPQVVVLTSCELVEYPNQLCCYVLSRENVASAIADTQSGSAWSLVEGNATSQLQMTRIIVDKHSDFHYTGTGDVTCALLTAWVHKLTAGGDNNDVGGVSTDRLPDHACGQALRLSISTIQAILRQAKRNATAKMARMSAAEESNIPAASTTDTAAAAATAAALQAIKCRLVELPIIQCKADIESPQPLPIEVCTSWMVPIADV